MVYEVAVRVAFLLEGKVVNLLHAFGMLIKLLHTALDAGSKILFVHTITTAE